MGHPDSATGAGSDSDGEPSRRLRAGVVGAGDLYAEVDER